MNKKILILLIPLFSVLLMIFIGGIYNAKASDTEYSINDGTVLSYLGSDNELVIPTGVQRIGAEAFAGNTRIESVIIPEGVTEIGYAAFNGCTSLKYVSLPNSLVSIGDSAFNECALLNDIKLGTAFSQLGSGAFGGCDSLRHFSVAAENNNFKVYDYGIYNGDMSVMYQYLASSPVENFTIPTTVKDIRRYCFWGCDNLKNVTVSGLTDFDDYAFSNADGLQNVTMTEPLRAIGVGAFSGCEKLQQVSIPISTGRIHETAFEGCPDTLTLICEAGSQAEAFAQQYGYPCSTVPVYDVVYEGIAYQPMEEDKAETEDVDKEENTAAEAGSGEAGESGTIAETQEAASVDYPVGTPMGGTQVVSDRAYVIVDGYTVNDGATMLPEVNIEDYAHYQDTNIRNLNEYKGQRIGRIGIFAFARSGLTSAVIPDGVTEIAEGAFYHCDQLKDVRIPDSVVSVGSNAFTFTPWYEDWLQNGESDWLIVGDGVLIAYKGTEENVELPPEVKTVAEGVFSED